MRKITITFWGENEDMVANCLAREIGNALEASGVESTMVSIKEKEKEIQVPEFMRPSERQIRRMEKRRGKRRAGHGRKGA